MYIHLRESRSRCASVTWIAAATAATPASRGSPYACCPRNVMRTMASLEHYVALSSDTEVRLHQSIPGTLCLRSPGAMRCFGWKRTTRGTDGCGWWSSRFRRRAVARAVDSAVGGEVHADRQRRGRTGRLSRVLIDGGAGLGRSATRSSSNLPLDVRFTPGRPSRRCHPPLPRRGTSSAGLLPRGRRPSWPTAGRPGARTGLRGVDGPRPGAVGRDAARPGRRARTGAHERLVVALRFRPAADPIGTGSEDVRLTAVPYFAWATARRARCAFGSRLTPRRVA